ncbi:glycosyltransferase family 4 protein [Autumnicola edwardsiae]|uniref:Glycosyltransferase family 4 protein n=1 Tax=Autumnicola edwardsiae TaxID=3075594 RepID=A0ABU3CUY6_9FLAO|nr:glycosyltransferase family 4 protein [Zunongwangia sp. F297]MDT0650159.1 glycosyltransferase family 4 protein [Zunongwangia sp. F297]
MTVLHVSGARSWGGNEQQLIYLIDELKKQGVEQKIFCFNNTPLHEEVKKYDIAVLSTDTLKPHSLEYLKFLNSIIKEHKIDIIHLHSSDSVTGYVLTDLFYSLKTPTLFARKGIRRKTGLFSRLKYNYKNIDKILCISKYVERHFSEILKKENQKKLVTVYNGVKIENIPQETEFQIREKLKLEEGTFLIGNIANHTNAKDLPVLIDTLDILVHKFNIRNVHIVQIGQFSKLTPVLKEKIKKLDLQAHITLMGFVKNASAYHSQFDVFIMTSEREGGPSSVIEAFYKKTPVISTKVGVVDEVIKDGHNGFTAEVKDPEKLAEKLYKFINNPELAEKFRERSYNIFLEKFTAEQLGKNTLKVYQDLLANTRR